MIKLKFNNQKYNFFSISSLVKQNGLIHWDILEQATQQGVLVDDNKNLLLKFINSIKTLYKNYYINDTKSQLYQDFFASFIVGDKFEKTFLEFGATDGASLSNTFILEKFLDWQGVLAEPSPQWLEKLKNNRPNTDIISECIWSESGKDLDFFVSEAGEFSTINEFKFNDSISIPGNTESRLRKGQVISVKTISLNDVITKNFNSKTPSYISIDTEGSEYEILKPFDFKKYRPHVFTIEHNFSLVQSNIDKLMKLNDYVRIFDKITEFDGWYISREAFNLLNNS